jgi:PPK2 family polyphosphate:nucleotide phosphotransferase
MKGIPMFEAISGPYLVPFDGSFRYNKSLPAPPEDAPGKKKCKEKLSNLVAELDELQRILYANNQYALLLVFQAMDAAGKDSTIRAVMSGVNPAGCQVFSFKQPTPEELDHDFLWRTTRCLPERGRIGIFNRSYYEEVLVVRVHPEFLNAQRLPSQPKLDQLWQERYESIRDYEKHLAKNGTIILKFWLNVSLEEQRNRFLERIEEPEKNWKFAPADVNERRYWNDYMKAFEDALNATSRSWAPWYAIPADSKAYMRYCVAEIIVDHLKKLGLLYPEIGTEEQAKFKAMRKILEEEKKAR